MTHRNVLRAAVVALSVGFGCRVYDSSLLVGSAGASGADAASAGSSGTVPAASGIGGALSGGAGGLDNQHGGASDEGGEAGTTAEGGSNSAGQGNQAGTSGSAGNGGTSGSSASGGTSGSAGKGAGGSAGKGAGGSAGKGAGGGAGSSGSGAGGGTIGSSGSGAGGASSGSSGSGAGGGAGSSGSGAGGGSALANGCARLSVPLVASGNKARFVITLANSTNFSGATISMRVYVKTATGGVITNYVQDSAYNVLKNATPAELATLAGWQILTWNIAAQGPGSTGISLTGIVRVGIEINAAPDSAWSNPTLVYVDSLTVTSPALSFSFDTSGTVNPSPSILDLTGQVLWQNAYTEDTTASNVTLGWLTSCP